MINFRPMPLPGTFEYAALAKELGIDASLGQFGGPERKVIDFAKAKTRRECRQKRASDEKR